MICRLSAAKKLILALAIFFIPFCLASDLDINGDSAKNVILLIGDGMSSDVLEAARIEKAHWNHPVYEKNDLFMDDLDFIGKVATLNADYNITDSAAAATAMATGHKTKNGVISQTATAITGEKDGKNLISILELAEGAGLSTGVITTARITHATPATFYSHVNNRYDESRIADQLLTSGVEVALGGGSGYFIGINDINPLDGKSARDDDRNLINEFVSQGYIFVHNGTEFREVDASETDELLGLFDNSSMNYESERKISSKDPTLAEMTEKAISILSKNHKGFFLMVEGGRIDHAIDEMNLRNTIIDTLAFDDAVKASLDFAAKNDDTLIMVTSDHAKGGLAIMPGPRYDFDGDAQETAHTASDVPIRASGPGAEQVSKGRLDNTDVFGIMKSALGI